MWHLAQPPPVSCLCRTAAAPTCAAPRRICGGRHTGAEPVLDEALRARSFWHVRNIRQSEETLGGVYSALTEAFGLGMHTAAVQVQPSARCPPVAPLLWAQPDPQSRQDPPLPVPPGGCGSLGGRRHGRRRHHLISMVHAYCLNKHAASITLVLLSAGHAPAPGASCDCKEICRFCC